jgi:hypothetical protein
MQREGSWEQEGGRRREVRKTGSWEKEVGSKEREEIDATNK